MLFIITAECGSSERPHWKFLAVHGDLPPRKAPQHGFPDIILLAFLSTGFLFIAGRFSLKSRPAFSSLSFFFSMFLLRSASWDNL